MKTIIAGSREGFDYEMVSTCLSSVPFTITEVVCGGAKGVDSFGAQWGRNHGIPVVIFPADWKKHGRSAGMIRNHEMADYADALVAFWDGNSKGTRHMITDARRKGLKVVVFRE